MQPVAVRSATLSDAETLVDFNCRLAQESEDLILDRTTVHGGVVRGLQVGEEVRYFVAELEGRIVGQLMLTREWSDWRNGWIIWLQSLYVVAEYRRQGIFRAIFDHVRQHCLSEDVACLRLYVEEENHSAIETYIRLGFKDANYRVMELSVK